MKVPKEQKSTRTLIALMLVVLGPALCVVWFMNVAMRNERLAVQQTLTDAYHNHLLSLQRQLATVWKDKQGAFKAITNSLPAEIFAAVVRSGLADAIVVYDTPGTVLYPSAPRSAGSGQTKDPPEWAQAQALEFQSTNYVAAAEIYGRIAQQTSDIHTKARVQQSQAACLLKAGQKAKAVDLLATMTEDASFQAALSDHGALLVPNAQLLLLKLTNDSRNPRFQQILEHLTARLNDYSEPLLSANQRRFLMEEAETLAGEKPAGQNSFHSVPEISGQDQAKTRKPFTPALSPSDRARAGVKGGSETEHSTHPQGVSKTPFIRFPTLEAERLAAEYLDSQPVRPADSIVQPTQLRGVLQCLQVYRER